MKGIEYNIELIKKMKIEVDSIVTGVKDEEELFKQEKSILRLDLPNSWNINKKGNMEIEMETDFEKFLLMVSEHTTEDIKEITVFRFYALIQYIKEKNTKK